MLPVDLEPNSALPLLAMVARSGLFDAAQSAQLEQRFAKFDDERAARLIDQLLRRGRITSFQLNRLRNDAGKSLHLGPYRLLTPIDRGGMGLVYFAERIDDGTPTALKVLPPRRAVEEPRMLLRFRRESALGLLVPDHPALVKTLEAGIDGGVNFLALEYVPGQTLRQFLQQSGPLPIGVAARLFARLAEGLAALHRAGIVHRDLKPSNLIGTLDGGAKWLDFGLAKRMTDIDDDPEVFGGKGYAVGTMDYIAPEQARDASSVGPAADLYSFGCCLYEALTGRPPFPGGTPAEKIDRHRNAHFPDIHFENPTIPSEFAQLLFWLTHKKPRYRPTDADNVASQLSRWAEAKPPTPPAIDKLEVIRRLEARRLERQAVAASEEVPEVASRETDAEASPIVPAKVRLGRFEAIVAAVLIAVLTASAFALGLLLG